MKLQVHIPSNPLQPGPIYFLTGRKAGIFGICCEAIPEQRNFIIDEAMDTGKGGNVVVSMLHYYLEHFGIHATNLHLNQITVWDKTKTTQLSRHHLRNFLTSIVFYSIYHGE